jgi:HK97 family phage major capsid protein
MKKLQEGALKADNTPYSAEEIKTNNEFVELVQTAVKEETAGLITKEQHIEAVDNAIKVATEPMQKELKKLYDAAIKQGLELSTIKGNGSVKDMLTIEKQLDPHIDTLRAMKGNKGSHDFVIKTEYTRASVTSNPMGYMLPEIGLIGGPKLGLFAVFPTVAIGPESNGVIRYIDQTLGTKNAAATAESATYNESAITFQGYTLPIEKIGSTIPITDEVFRHTARLADEIGLFMQTDVAAAVESNLAVGDGNTPNLKGVYTSATAYTASAAGVQDANIFDLLVKMSEDITGNITYGGKYMPDVAIMNISDINKMKLKKDANNNYIIPPFVSADGKQVNGITIIESPFIAANTLVMGDRRFARIYTDGEVEVGFNYVASDWKQDVITMKARRFLALLVRTVDATGWRKSTDIDADLATISGVVVP